METILRSRPHQYLTRAIIILVTTALIVGTVGCGGAAPVTFEIRDWYDLDAIREHLANPCVLMNDLDATTPGYEELAGPNAHDGKGWKPIIRENYALSGTIDGQGHVIRDLFINRPDEELVGLFGGVHPQGVIDNIGLLNADVSGGGVWVGGLVGRNEGSVSNSYSGGNVIGESDVGGLAGVNTGTVINCYFSGNVTGDSEVGGLVGSNLGPVNECYSAGNVIGSSHVGGLVGYNDNLHVTFPDEDEFLGTVISSYSSSNITGDSTVGGLVGRNSPLSTVSTSYSSGSVTGDEHVGGLVGANGGTVTKSYATGNVTGQGGYYSGGLVGLNEGTVSECFWDMDTSGIEVSDGGTGKTAAEMMNITTFTDTATVGLDEPWDIVAVASTGERNSAYIWNIVDGETYPFLNWQSVS